MAYTEIKVVNDKEYYYRARTVREGRRYKKRRIYLGVDLDGKTLKQSEDQADRELGVLSKLLFPNEILYLKDLKKRYAQEPVSTLDNRYEAFVSLFTYDSTAIEGNSLTLQETSYLLFERRVPKEKSLREINESLNHKRAFDYLLEYEGDITKVLMCTLHALVVRDTLRDDSQVGVYRTVQNYIGGREWIPPKPEHVHKEMATLLKWYTRHKNNLHPLVLASYFHVAFEAIHPFVDGNGRVGRLLLNFILYKRGYPMINIPANRKFEYYQALRKATETEDLRSFVELMISVYKKSRLFF